MARWLSPCPAEPFRATAVGHPDDPPSTPSPEPRPRHRACSGGVSFGQSGRSRTSAKNILGVNRIAVLAPSCRWRPCSATCRRSGGEQFHCNLDRCLGRHISITPVRSGLEPTLTAPRSGKVHRAEHDPLKAPQAPQAAGQRLRLSTSPLKPNFFSSSAAPSAPRIAFA